MTESPQQLTPQERFRIQQRFRERFSSPAKTLEAQGWQVWLKTLAPDSFSAPFSKEHIEFWDLFWSILMRKKRGEAIPPHERNVVVPLGRGMAKSTMAEMAAIAEGCILDQGFALYLSDSQQLAEEHVYSVKAILETPIFAKYYPRMSRPKMQQTGAQAKFTQDTIITDNGWALTARGITANVRGGRVGSLRFTLVISDDIDNLNDSLMVIEKKKRILSRTVYPAMAKDGITIFAQNLITGNSVASQIITRKTDILSQRTVIGGGGGVKAFNQLELEQVDTIEGSRPWRIKHCVPAWEYFNVQDAEAFLALSGKEAFLAEYQHEFDEKTGKVISNYDEDAQVITWSMFEKVFGCRYIPQHWRAAVGLDVGYSDGMHPHYSAWVFIAVSAMNSPLPGKHFIYRGRDFTATSIDDQAIEIWKDICANPQRPYPEFEAPFSLYPALQRQFGTNKCETRDGLIKHWQMSHERTGEMLTLNQKYGMPFGKFQHWKATDGVAQWNNLSQCDLTQPNPFKDDQECTDGWLIGCPGVFYIVDDDQLENPRDHRGLKLMREQIKGWEWVKTKILESGLTEEKPSKINDDYCFVAGTRIKTLRGEIPIEQVRLDDYILTRAGYQKCLNHGLTNANAQTVEVHLSNGTVIQGTPNHPIWVNGKHFIALQDISLNDTLELWQNQSVLTLMVWHIIGILKQSKDHIGFTIKPISRSAERVLRPCTSLFGKVFTDASLMVGTFITRMITPLTTIFATSNVLQYATTDGCTTTSFRQRKNSHTLPVFATPLPSPSLQNGIRVPKASNGIDSKLLSLGLASENRKKQFVSSARKNLRASITTHVFARSNVIGGFSRQVNRIRVGLRLCASIAETFRGAFARPSDFVTVVAKTSSTGRRPVYNLTVAKQPEYYANGILVHNCDPIKSLFQYFLEIATPLTDVEKIVAQMPPQIRTENIQTAEQMMGRQMYLDREFKKLEERRVSDDLAMEFPK